jgi:hypothetical protein
MTEDEVADEELVILSSANSIKSSMNKSDSTPVETFMLNPWWLEWLFKSEFDDKWLLLLLNGSIDIGRPSLGIEPVTWFFQFCEFWLNGVTGFVE